MDRAVAVPVRAITTVSCVHSVSAAGGAGIEMYSGSTPTHRLPLIIHLRDLIVDPLRSITPARLETRPWTINRRHPARPARHSQFAQ